MIRFLGIFMALLTMGLVGAALIFGLTYSLMLFPAPTIVGLGLGTLLILTYVIWEEP